MAWELRDDDPPFREFFSSQPDYVPSEAIKNMKPKVRTRHVDLRPKRQKTVVNAPIVEELPPKVPIDDDMDMITVADVVSMVLEISKGQSYVKVDKLLEKLRG